MKQFTKEFTEEQVIQAFQNQPLHTLSTLAEKIGCERQTARKLVQSLVLSGYLVKNKIGCAFLYTKSENPTCLASTP